MNQDVSAALEQLTKVNTWLSGLGEKRDFNGDDNQNRVGGRPLFERPSSHTTVRTVRYTAVQ
jgi:hypothetical protein